MAWDGAGNMYVLDTGSNRVRKVDAVSRIVTTIAGTGTAGFSGDGGPAISARLTAMKDVTVDRKGNVFVLADNRVRMIAAATGLITTVAGTGTCGNTGDGSSATAAQITPKTITLDPAGNLYLLGSGLYDCPGNGVRVVTNGMINTVPGTSGKAYTGIAIDGGGAVFLSFSFGGATSFGGVIFKVENGMLTPVAGNGQIASGTPTDGPALQAGMLPLDLAIDSNGALYFVEDTGFSDLQQKNLTHVGGIRKVPAGTVTTLYRWGSRNDSGDGDLATLARFGDAVNVAFDRDQNLYIADFAENRFHRVDAHTGIMTQSRGLARLDTTETTSRPRLHNSMGLTGWLLVRMEAYMWPTNRTGEFDGSRMESSAQSSATATPRTTATAFPPDKLNWPLGG
jgi:sugar lactone lactonase YvrE